MTIVCQSPGNSWSHIRPPCLPSSSSSSRLKAFPVQACQLVFSLFEPYEIYFTRRKLRQRQVKLPRGHIRTYRNRQSWGRKTLLHPCFDHYIPCPLRALSPFWRLSLTPHPASLSSSFLKDLLSAPLLGFLIAQCLEFVPCLCFIYLLNHITYYQEYKGCWPLTLPPPSPPVTWHGARHGGRKKNDTR